MDILTFTWNIGLNEAFIDHALQHLLSKALPFIAAFQEVPAGVERRFYDNRVPDVAVCAFQQRGERNLLVLASQSLAPVPSIKAHLAGRTAVGRVGNASNLVVVAIHGPDLRNNPEGPNRDQSFGAHYRTFIREIVCDVRGVPPDYDDPRADDRTVVLGDFNAFPFSNEVASTGGLWALRDRWRLGDVATLSRGMANMRISPFYNPMWDHLSERLCGQTPRAINASEPRGTFHQYSPGKGTRWCVIDQVVVSQDLADAVDRPQILSIINGVNLLTKKGTLDKADHLPVQMTIRI